MKTNTKLTWLISTVLLINMPTIKTENWKTENVKNITREVAKKILSEYNKELNRINTNLGIDTRTKLVTIKTDLKDYAKDKSNISKKTSLETNIKDLKKSFSDINDDLTLIIKNLKDLKITSIELDPKIKLDTKKIPPSELSNIESVKYLYQLSTSEVSTSEELNLQNEIIEIQNKLSNIPNIVLTLFQPFSEIIPLLNVSDLKNLINEIEDLNSKILSISQNVSNLNINLTTIKSYLISNLDKQYEKYIEKLAFQQQEEKSTETAKTKQHISFLKK